MAYEPMTVAPLGELLATCADHERWLMISEFPEEHPHVTPERRLDLLQAEPPPIGDERWDVFSAAIPYTSSSMTVSCWRSPHPAHSR